MAGRQAGFDEGSNTRSSLLWQVKRLLLECKEIGEMPQVLWMENVDAIANKKNMPNFQKWLDFLDSIGYKSYYQKLNGKDYGIPQNRSRMFVCSLLSNKPYIFPDPIPLEKRLKDVLESNVDESYYINSEKAQKLIVELLDRGVLPQNKEVVPYDDYNSNIPKDTTCLGTITSTIGNIALRHGQKLIENERERINGESILLQDTHNLEKSQTQSKQRNEESQTLHKTKSESLKITAHMNNVKIDKVNVDVAKTLCARDWKGFGTGFDTMNGVIETNEYK